MGGKTRSLFGFLVVLVVGVQLSTVEPVHAATKTGSDITCSFFGFVLRSFGYCNTPHSAQPPVIEERTFSIQTHLERGQVAGEATTTGATPLVASASSGLTSSDAQIIAEAVYAQNAAATRYENALMVALSMWNNQESLGTIQREMREMREAISKSIGLTREELRGSTGGGGGTTVDVSVNGTLSSPTLNGTITLSDLPSNALLFTDSTGALSALSDLGVDDSGNVLIGTTTAYEQLTVAGPLYLGDATPTTTTNRLYSVGGSLFWNGSQVVASTSGNWTGSGGNVYRLSGSVGIGTTSPSYDLAVDGDIYATGALIDSAGDSGASGFVLQSTGGGFDWVATSSLGINGTADDLSDNVLADLSDVGAATINGSLLYYDGSDWDDIATSALNISTSDLVESGNLFFTTDRFAATLSGTTTDALSEGVANRYYSTLLFASDLSGTTTDALSEGSVNRYYADSLVAAYINGSTTLLSTNTEAGLEAYLTGVTDVFTNNDTIGDANISDTITATNYLSLADWYATTTDGLAEGGTRLYYTDARVDANILASSSISRLGQLITESELDITGSPTDGYILQASSTSGGGFTWVATSSLGISGGGGASTFVALTDTPGSLATGDIFYSPDGSTLASLAAGGDGTVLKISGGVPTWGADLGGSGGSGAWATSTNNLLIYPADTNDVVVIGGSATTAPGYDLEVIGSVLAPTLDVDTLTATTGTILGNLDVATAVAIGDSATPSTNELLNINGSVTNNSDFYSIYNNPQVTATLSGNSSAYGLYSLFEADAISEGANDYEAVAVYGEVQVDGSSSVGTTRAGQFIVDYNSTSGTGDNAYTLSSTMEVAGGATINTGYGYFSDLSIGGTVNNYYGIFLQDVVEGSMTNAYAIWVNEGDLVLDADGTGAPGGNDGGSDLFFGEGQDAAIWYDGTNFNLNPQRIGSGALVVPSGRVGIGSSTPMADLSVAGSLAVTGGFYDATSELGAAGDILTSTGAGTDWVSSLPAANGGTGLTAYTAGDILYASGATALSALGVGGEGTVLKVSGGVPSWGTDLSGGGGGGSSVWATTTDGLAIYPVDPNDVVVVGATATTAPGFAFEVIGDALTSGLETNSATTTNLTVNAERFIDLTGDGLTNSANALAVSCSDLEGTGIECSSNNFQIAFTEFDTDSISEGSSNFYSRWDVGFGTLSYDEATDRVGIGDADPDYTLELAGSNNNGYFGVSSNAAGDGDIFEIDGSGNVGVGTNEPDELLHISGGNLLLENTQSIRWENNAATANTIMAYNSSNDLEIGSGIGNNLELYGADIIFFSSSDELGRFDASGNFGLGDTTPDYRLEIAATGTSGYLAISSTTDGDILSILETGNIGIGTSSPAAKLEIDATAGGDNLLLSDGAQSWALNTASGGQFSIVDRNTNVTRLEFNAAKNLNVRGADGATSHFFINGSNGNVGISTSSPQRFFSVAGDAYITGALYDNANSAGTNGMVLQSDGSGFNWVGTSSLGFADSLWTQNGSDIYFASGDVGIGTTTPDTLLHLVDNTNANFLLQRTGSGPSELSLEAVDNSARIFANDSNDDLVFGAGGTEYIRLTDAGVVGIGTSTDLNARLSIQTSGSVDILNLFETGGEEVFTVLESGDVGIGVTSTLATLQVAGDTASAPATTGSAPFSGLRVGGGNFGVALDMGVQSVASPIYSWIQSRQRNSFGTNYNLVLQPNGGNIGIGTTTDLDARLSIQTTGTTDILNLYEADGDEVFTVLENGNVGIGTSSPTAVLAVAGPDGQIAKFANEGAGSGSYIELRNETNDKGGYIGQNLPGLSSITDQGNFGITIGAYDGAEGTDVEDGIKINTNGTEAIQFFTQDAVRAVLSSTGDLSLGTTTENGRLTIQTSGTTDILNLLETDGEEVFTVLENGNVGIGTSAPATVLHVTDVNNETLTPLNANVALRLTDSDGSVLADQVTGVIQFFTNDLSGGPGINSYISGRNANTSGDGVLTFGTGGSGSPSERLRIAETGNIGIGTSTDINARLSIQTSGSVDILNLYEADGAEVFTVLENGNVGIGGNTPGQTLDVDGSYSFDSSVGELTSRYSLRSVTARSTDATYVPFTVAATGGQSANILEVVDSSFATDFFVIDSTGNVGVGTSTPDQPLDLYLTSARHGIAIDNGGTGGRRWTLTSSNDSSLFGGGLFTIYDDTSNSARLSIDGSGYVGIGTTTPDSLLHVTGTLTLGERNVEDGQLILYDSSIGQSGRIRYLDGALEVRAGNNQDLFLRTSNGTEAVTVYNSEAGNLNAGYVGIQDTTPDFGLEVAVSSVNGFFGVSSASSTDGDLLIVDGSGNVGIGTTSPSTMLQLADDAEAVLLIEGDIAGGAIDDTGLRIKARGTDYWFAGVGSVDAGLSPDFRLSNGTDADTNPRLTVKTTGNVGIGTTTPAEALVVEGNIALGGNNRSIMADRGDGGLISIIGMSGNQIQIGESTSGPNGVSILTPIDAGQGLNVLQSDGSTSALFVENDGNVGIGTTSPGYELEIDKLNARVFLDRNATNVRSWLGFATAGAGDWYLGSPDSDNAGDGSEFFISTADAGNDAAFWIETNGNVGIGTTSPGALLDVYGTIDITGAGTLDIDGLTRISSGGRFWSASASAGSPGYSFNGDTDTGIYRSAEDEFTFSTGGADRMTVNASGNVGIGTTSPFAKLHVLDGTPSGRTSVDAAADNLVLESLANTGMTLLSGADQLANIYFADTNDQDVGRIIYDHSDDSLNLYTNNTLGLTLNNTGNVGIGTTSPTRALEVYDTIDVVATFASNDTNALISFVDPATNGPISTRIGTDNGDFVAFTDGSERLRISETNGNVGIGTTSPAAALDVWGSLQVGTSSLPTFQVQADLSQSIFNGSVGIGTTTPSELLQLSGGNIAIDRSQSYGVDHEGTFYELVGVNSGNDRVFGALSSNTNSRILLDGQSNGTITFQSNAEDIIFSNNALNTENMRLLANGNLGIGTSTPDRPLHVESSADILAQFYSTNGNATISFADGDTTLPLSYRLRLGAIGDDMVFFTNSNERLRITNNGEIGIDNSNPLVALHIGSTSVTDTTDLLRLEDANSVCNFNADSGAPSCGSDLTLKKSVEIIEDELTRLVELEPSSWLWKTDTYDADRKYGFIAQNVEEQFPDLVTESLWVDGTTRKFLNTGGLMPYVVGAVKEQQETLEELFSTGTSERGASSPFYALFDGEEDTVWERLVAVAQGYGDGVLELVGIETSELYARDIQAELIETETLCVGSTCITESELLALLANQATGSATTTQVVTPGNNTETTTNAATGNDNSTDSSSSNSSNSGSTVSSTTAPEINQQDTSASTTGSTTVTEAVDTEDVEDTSTSTTSTTATEEDPETTPTSTPTVEEEVEAEPVADETETEEISDATESVDSIEDTEEETPADEADVSEDSVDNSDT